MKCPHKRCRFVEQGKCTKRHAIVTQGKDGKYYCISAEINLPLPRVIRKKWSPEIKIPANPVFIGSVVEQGARNKLREQQERARLYDA